MANNELVVLLREGTAAGWNRWRSENADAVIDLSNADLRGSNLTRANLAGVDLTEANLSEVSLARADLTGAKLRGTILWRATFNGAIARAIDGKYAGLRMAHLNGTDLCGADLEGADAQGAVLHGTRLANARIAWADFGQTDIDGADFTGAEAVGTNFRGARIVGATFRDANLAGADLTGAFERGSTTEGAADADLVVEDRDGVRVTADGLALARLAALVLDKAALAGDLDVRHSRVALLVGRFPPEAAGRAAAAVRAAGRVPVVIDGAAAAPEPLRAASSRLAAIAAHILVDAALPASERPADGARLVALPLAGPDGAAAIAEALGEERSP